MISYIHAHNQDDEQKKHRQGGAVPDTEDAESLLIYIDVQRLAILVGACANMLAMPS